MNTTMDDAIRQSRQKTEDHKDTCKVALNTREKGVRCLLVMVVMVDVKEGDRPR